MKIHRFIGNFDLSGNSIDIEDIEIVKQIRNVLKLEIGEKLVLSDGRGQEAEVEITELLSRKISCEILKTEHVGDTGRLVNLYLAVLKKDNFELAVQKATECGVTNIIPVITERTVKTGLNMERLQKIVREASEQSGRSIVPKIFETMSFEEALSHGENSHEKIIFHLVEEKYVPDKNANSISIFVGPEGGFTENEINLAKESSYKVASLGALTLRGETAAIVATYRAVQGI